MLIHPRGLRRGIDCVRCHVMQCHDSHEKSGVERERVEKAVGFRATKTDEELTA